MSDFPSTALSNKATNHKWLIKAGMSGEYKIQTTWILKTFNEKKKAEYLNMICTDYMLK